MGRVSFPRFLRAQFGGMLLANLFYISAIGWGTLLLFVIDISAPRGVLDGIGYAALVALASRYGNRLMTAFAAGTTFLTIAAGFLLPNEGVSVGAMWANRSFAIASIWIVAYVVSRRLEVEAAVAKREEQVRGHQAALEFMMRECLLSDLAFEDRIDLICRTSADALQADGVTIASRNGDGTTTITNAWHRHPDRPFVKPRQIVKEDPKHSGLLATEFVVAVDDIDRFDFGPEMYALGKALGVSATLSAEIFHGAPLTGVIAFVKREKHHWTQDECAFVRAIGSLAGLLMSGQQNLGTLAALDLARDGIFTEDQWGKIQYANRAAREFAEEAIGQSDYPRPPAPLAGDFDRSEISFAGREFEIRRARLPAGGVIVHISDVTPRKLAEAERAELEDRLHQSTKMEAIGQLASGIAHDFNNILGAINGFAGFIAQDPTVDDQNRDFARRIHSASKRGKEMVEQIMTFAETRVVTHGITNLGRAVQNSWEVLSATIPPGSSVDVKIPEMPVLIRGNEVQIDQLINNLITNGIESGRGAIEVRVTIASPDEVNKLNQRYKRTLELVLGEPVAGCEYALLEVSDNGTGISPDVMRRMFEPFFSTKGRQRGTGLGLAVVHGVIKAHRGICHVRSEVGLGTVFSVYLPLAQASAAVEVLAGRRLLKPCRVMVVDDEEDMVDMLSIGLERLGYETVAVQNPLIALSAIEKDPGAFDALLTDHIMPRMKGIDLIREARRVAPGLRMVLCTGNAGNMSEVEALALGADAVLYKPVDIQAVAEALSGVSQAAS
jgi:signal transduction histidine kinase/ActR/RegA family two-component response regulator